MKYDLKNICEQFSIQGSFTQALPYGTGHINDTYCVTFNTANGNKRYILQRINHNIFKRPAELMDNVVRVTNHIQAKLKAANTDPQEIARRTLTVIPTREGNPFHQDSAGNYWRTYIFIEKAKTYDVLEQLNYAYEAAKAFGEFQNMLVDLPQPPLFDTIPDFHNGIKRFEAFRKALEADSHCRAKEAKTEIEFLQSHSWIFDVVPKLTAEGKLPIRITHNDTKINNVMLDDVTGKGICVIDLDTVMPGSALFDFGDIARTTLSPAAEDEQDLSKVFMEMPRFEAILKGYLASAGKFLNQTEKEHLIFAGKLITLIIGTRFLTDFLAGDVYFKIHREKHNLDRCRTQFKLVQSIEENEDKMLKLVEKFSA
jgi:hypothetical protein